MRGCCCRHCCCCCCRELVNSYTLSCCDDKVKVNSSLPRTAPDSLTTEPASRAHASRVSTQSTDCISLSSRPSVEHLTSHSSRDAPRDCVRRVFAILQRDIPPTLDVSGSGADFHRVSGRLNVTRSPLDSLLASREKMVAECSSFSVYDTLNRLRVYSWIRFFIPDAGKELIRRDIMKICLSDITDENCEG